MPLPTRAQLLELRRAGVTEYRCSSGDETVLLTLRPLYSSRRPDERKKSTASNSRPWPQKTAAQIEWDSLSRGQRRRRNIRMDKMFDKNTIEIQRAARGYLARLTAKKITAQTAAVTLIQSRMRRCLAVRKARQLKESAPQSDPSSAWIPVRPRKKRAHRSLIDAMPSVRHTHEPRNRSTTISQPPQIAAPRKRCAGLLHGEQPNSKAGRRITLHGSSLKQDLRLHLRKRAAPSVQLLPENRSTSPSSCLSTVVSQPPPAPRKRRAGYAQEQPSSKVDRRAVLQQELRLHRAICRAQHTHGHG